MQKGKNRNSGWVWTLILGATLLVAACSGPKNAGHDHEIEAGMVPMDSHRTMPMRGLCWTGGDSVTGTSMRPLQELSVNWISQTPFGWMGAYNKPDIGMMFGKKGYYWGEQDNGLAITHALAREKGIKTMMKPHLWMTGRDGKWRSDIAMESEADWKLWFENYARFILHYAQLAEQEGMESLCIGTELHKTVKHRPDDWRNLIAKIRKVYKGKLTYAANFYHEYEDLSFWDALDFIGIQGYFPLTKANNPKLDDLLSGWKEHVKAIEKVAKKFNKKVVFTEIGYKSTKDAAIEPWVWPNMEKASFADTSNSTQERCYEAMFQTFHEVDWVEGFFIWKWHPEHAPRTLSQEAQQQKMKDSLKVTGQHKEYPQIGFTPQDKPAEMVLKKWYGKWQEKS